MGRNLQTVETRYVIDPVHNVPLVIADWVENSATDKLELLSKTTTKWRHTKSASVPIDVVMSSDSVDHRIELTWESVNEPIDPTTFHFMQWAKGNGDWRVFDNRARKAVQVGIVSGGNLAQP